MVTRKQRIVFHMEEAIDNLYTALDFLENDDEENAFVELEEAINEASISLSIFEEGEEPKEKQKLSKKKSRKF